MTDYTLHYWPIAFRGQFVRAVLTHVGAEWAEMDFDSIVAAKNAAPADQPVPFMGPPLLTDHEAGVCLAQMPAILAYLGRKHGLLPDDPAGEAMTHKIVADANDVLYEMTRYNGAQMWTDAAWADYRPRLARWMAIFEQTGRRHGLQGQDGFILGTGAAGLADLTAATLWGTMTDKLPALRPLLDETAPAIAGLCDRIASDPGQAALKEKSDAAYGNRWCGGQIEASLRAVL
jgi:glutathione S-transferase